MSSSGFALSLFLQFGVQNLICFKGYGPTDPHLSTCVVSRFLLFTDQSKLLVPAIGIAQLLAQLRFGNWYCLAIGIASAIGIAKAIGIASTCLFWKWDLLSLNSNWISCFCAVTLPMSSTRFYLFLFQL